MRKWAVLSFAALTGFHLVATMPVQPVMACTAADFSEVVDDTARALRELNVNGAERYNAKLREFQKKYNLSQDDVRQRAASLQDDKMSEFNREIETLVTEMDVLSRTPTDEINCAKLDNLKQVRDRLLTVMGQKSGYMLAKVDEGLSQPFQTTSGKQDRALTTQEVAAAESETAAPEPDAAEPQAGSEDRSAEAQGGGAGYLPPTSQPEPVESPSLPERRPAFAPETAPQDPVTISGEEQTLALADPEQQPDNSAWSTVPAEMVPPAAPEDETFSIDEIRDAGRGIFGTLTAEFAGAVNYAFQNFGKPNAYITGSEGGAAFLAGLRYGSGKLYRKTAEPTSIYWQGPSLGYDVGAEGSNTLFLVYNVKDPERLYGRFTGIGGSAYVAGGFGVNVLGKGGMVMVPIRTGIGLRIGANLAYLKFTERQTWNPF